MSEYRAEVYYSYRRKNICCGMTVSAVNVDDAMAKARATILRSYPAAKIHATKVTEGAAI